LMFISDEALPLPLWEELSLIIYVWNKQQYIYQMPDHKKVKNVVNSMDVIENPKINLISLMDVVEIQNEIFF
jgi:hypothetical protein